MPQSITKYLTPIVALFFATALGVTASSTIGTDISTGGNLTVTGTTTTAGLYASTTAEGADITLKASEDFSVNSKNIYFDLAEADLGLFSMTGDSAATDQMEFDPGSDYFLLQLDNSGSVADISFDLDASNYTTAQLYATAGAGKEASIEINSFGGDWAETILAADNRVTLQAGGGTEEINIDAGSVNMGYNTEFYPPKHTAPPVACAAGKAGAMYYDTNVNELCICNGTNWLEISDMATTCS